MAAVAIVAIDFAAIRACIGIPEVELLLLGALPMANVLAVGILVAQQRPGSRPFLLGFEAFAAMALALFVAFAEASPFVDNYGLMNSYLALAILPIENCVGRNRPFVFIPIALFAYVVMLGWPQLAFALIGGFLSRRFKIIIARR
jgi:hypothetical protein